MINDANQSHSLLSSLSTANVEKIPEILTQLTRYPRWIYWRELRTRVALSDHDSPARLGYSLALFPADPSQLDFLKERLLRANAAETAVLVEGLKQYQDTLKPWLWDELRKAKPGDRQILPVACPLAGFGPTNRDWNEVRAQGRRRDGPVEAG